MLGAFRPIRVCGLSDLADHIQGCTDPVLSIVNPERAALGIEAGLSERTSCALAFHDEVDPRDGCVLPGERDVKTILDFGRRTFPSALVVHCHSGISRSTAATAMIWAQDCPDRPAEAIMLQLLAVRPQCWPNSLMLELADKILGRSDSLAEAAIGLFRSRLQSDPLLAARMVRLRRSRDVEQASGSRAVS